ncbi:MAG: cytochrome C [Isosphaeraceae bacterium]|nr:cytochrome C [Isosphaeraceae bacterium]
MSRILLGLLGFGLTLGLLSFVGGEVGAEDGPSPARTSRVRARPNDAFHLVLAAQKKKTSKKGMPKKAGADDSAEKPATPAPDAKDDGSLKFSRDIAPILVDNCFGCHNAEQRKGKFDMTSFEKLMKGSDLHPVIESGKPDDSHLVLRLRGEEKGKPKMPPPQGQRRFSENAITKIEEWIKAGAKLDGGFDPKAPIQSYASTPQDLQLAAFKKMTPEQRDEHVKTVGLDHWKKAAGKETPEVATSKNFILFSTLPKARADATLKVMETQFTKLKGLLGPLSLDGLMKTSLYVFKERNSFVEFARAVENREVEADDQSTSNFGSAEPYVAVTDPLHGQDEPAAAATKKRARTKKDDDGPTADRTLPGIITEQLVIGLVNKGGKAPKWVALGLGAYSASQLERGSPYIMKLRRTAYDLCDQGWTTKAIEAMGDGTKAEDVRAVGYAVMDWMGTSSPGYVAPFVRGMLEGGDKLDDVIAKVFNGKREDLLNASGAHVMSAYGGRGR